MAILVLLSTIKDVFIVISTFVLVWIKVADFFFYVCFVNINIPKGRVTIEENV